MNFSEMERGLDAALKTGLSSGAAGTTHGGPFDRAHAVLSSARNVAERVVALRAQLLGQAAESSAPVAHRETDGVFGQLEAHADFTFSMLADAEAALAAIERALP